MEMAEAVGRLERPVPGAQESAFSVSFAASMQVL
jgi:hypothetical protein